MTSCQRSRLTLDLQEHLPILATSQVFVAGKQPTITYNPRDDRRLETDVRSYMDQPGKALSVSGPTKSGKTVLIERLLPPDRAIWIQGSDVESIEEFWRAIIDALNAFDHVAATLDDAITKGTSAGLQVGPSAINVNWNRTRSTSLTSSATGSRTRPLPDTARQALRETPYPVIVDDFHYIESPTKRALARAVKTLISNTHVILIAVPHEAFEVVREEPDMGARMWGLPIEHWSVDELKYIAQKGFHALRINDPGEQIGTQLARASYGAPFLMQQLCYDYAVSIGVTETQVQFVNAKPPDDWLTFFRRIADRAVPGVFEQLTKGPNPRGQQRIDRQLRDGQLTDIYGAILYAIPHAGQKSAISPSELARILERDFVNPPTRQQVVSSLGQLRKIARAARGVGDPVLDFKADTLHMLDPFLSFYLKYGSWKLPGGEASRHEDEI